VKSRSGLSSTVANKGIRWQPYKSHLFAVRWAVLGTGQPPEASVVRSLAVIERSNKSAYVSHAFW
jgi:hypothetical protein